MIFGTEAEGEHDKFDSLVTPYLAVGWIVVVVAIVFLLIKLPEIKEEKTAGEQEENPPMKNLLKHPVFIFAVVAQFLYVAAQTGTNSFFINYVIEAIHDLRTPIAGIMDHLGYFGEFFMPRNNEQAASLILAIGGMGAFWIGRLSGSYLMKFIAPNILLSIYALANVILNALVFMNLGWVSVFALF